MSNAPAPRRRRGSLPAGPRRGVAAEDVAGTERGAALGSEVRYSIRVASRLTAIEPDTLRVWERRYGYPRPSRTKGGSRLYSEADVQALLLVARALRDGYRPSEVVGRSHAELERLLRASPGSRSSTPGAALPTVESLLAALAHDDVRALRAGLRQAAVVLGPKRFVTDIAQPISVLVGERWAAGKLEVRHEHVLTECVSTQLGLLSSAYEEAADAPVVVLATLPGEPHALGLGMVALYLATSQVTPRVVGADTPAEQIVKAARAHAAEAVGLSVMASSDGDRAAKQVRWMLKELPRRVPIWIGGGGARALGIDEDGVRTVVTWPELDGAIASLRRASR